jgi:hypothetical protein
MNTSEFSKLDVADYLDNEDMWICSGGGEQEAKDKPNAGGGQ